MPNIVYQIFVGAFGGLDEIAARLPHIESLGADAIYLTPIFRAPSAHKYDTADYDVVDEAFGGDAAFDRLVRATRERGLGLILDGVFNHVGAEHRWAREKKFLRGTVWRGYPSLPELELQDPELREELFGNEGVIARWTRRGATGWRLDCANDLGPEICDLATLAARAAGATDGVVGEMMAWPNLQGGVDGAMNYWLRSCALQLAAGAPAQEPLDRLVRELEPGFLGSSWNILSSHDTPRLQTLLEDPARVRQALALAFVYPGIPMIYYGEEVGMLGGADPANRAPMIWENWDQDRLSLVRRLGKLRREEPALRDGRYFPLPAPDLVAFARLTDRYQDTLIFVANASRERRHQRLFVPLSFLHDAIPLEDLLGGAGAKMEAGTIALELAPHDVKLLKPRDDHPSGYRFWKC